METIRSVVRLIVDAVFDRRARANAIDARPLGNLSGPSRRIRVEPIEDPAVAPRPDRQPDAEPERVEA
jgi:hypothetical protein